MIKKFLKKLAQMTPSPMRENVQETDVRKQPSEAKPQPIQVDEPAGSQVGDSAGQMQTMNDPAPAAVQMTIPQWFEANFMKNVPLPPELATEENAKILSDITKQEADRQRAEAIGNDDPDLYKTETSQIRDRVYGWLNNVALKDYYQSQVQNAQPEPQQMSEKKERGQFIDLDRYVSGPNAEEVKDTIRSFMINQQDFLDSNKRRLMLDKKLGLYADPDEADAALERFQFQYFGDPEPGRQDERLKMLVNKPALESIITSDPGFAAHFQKFFANTENTARLSKIAGQPVNIGNFLEVYNSFEGKGSRENLKRPFLSEGLGPLLHSSEPGADDGLLDALQNIFESGELPKPLQGIFSSQIAAAVRHNRTDKAKSQGVSSNIAGGEGESDVQDTFTKEDGASTSGSREYSKEEIAVTVDKIKEALQGRVRDVADFNTNVMDAFYDYFDPNMNAAAPDVSKSTIGVTDKSTGETYGVAIGDILNAYIPAAFSQISNIVRADNPSAIKAIEKNMKHLNKQDEDLSLPFANQSGKFELLRQKGTTPPLEEMDMDLSSLVGKEAMAKHFARLGEVKEMIHNLQQQYGGNAEAISNAVNAHYGGKPGVTVNPKMVDFTLKEDANVAEILKRAGDPNPYGIEHTAKEIAQMFPGKNKDLTPEQLAEKKRLTSLWNKGKYQIAHQMVDKFQLSGWPKMMPFIFEEAQKIEDPKVKELWFSLVGARKDYTQPVDEKKVDQLRGAEPALGKEWWKATRQELAAAMFPMPEGANEKQVAKVNKSRDRFLNNLGGMTNPDNVGKLHYMLKGKPPPKEVAEWMQWREFNTGDKKRRTSEYGEPKWTPLSNRANAVRRILLAYKSYEDKISSLISYRKALSKVASTTNVDKEIESLKKDAQKHLHGLADLI